MARTVVAQHAGSAMATCAVSLLSCRGPGETRYLHTQNRVVPYEPRVRPRQRKGANMFVPRLICGPCTVEMTVEQNSIVVEMASSNGHKYKVSADLHRCPTCKTSAAYTALKPRIEGHQKGYDDTHADFTADFAIERIRRGVKNGDQAAE